MISVTDDSSLRVRRGATLAAVLLGSVLVANVAFVFFQRAQERASLPVALRNGQGMTVVSPDGAYTLPRSSIMAYNFPDSPDDLVAKLKATLPADKWRLGKRLPRQRKGITYFSYREKGQPVPTKYLIVGPGKWTDQGGFLAPNPTAGPGSSVLTTIWEPKIIGQYIAPDYRIEDPPPVAKAPKKKKGP